MSCKCGGRTAIKERSTEGGMEFVEICGACGRENPPSMWKRYNLIMSQPGKAPFKANSVPLNTDDLYRWITPLRRARRDNVAAFAGVTWAVEEIHPLGRDIPLFSFATAPVALCGAAHPVLS